MIGSLAVCGATGVPAVREQRALVKMFLGGANRGRTKRVTLLAKNTKEPSVAATALPNALV